MEERDQKSLSALVRRLKEFDESVIESLIHFVRVFEIYSLETWLAYTYTKNAPRRILILGARHPHWLVRESVAGNLKTPVGILEELRKDQAPNVRKSVVANLNTPPRILESMVGEEDSWVRRNLASNPNTPTDTLEKLATDSCTLVRLGVATNPNTPIGLLGKLAGEGDQWIRWHVARNQNTPSSLLEKLAKDTNKEVKVTARTNLRSRKK